MVQGPAPSSPQIVIVTRQRRGEAFGESSTFCHRTKEYRANATSIFWDVQDHVTSKWLLVDKHIYWERSQTLVKCAEFEEMLVR